MCALTIFIERKLALSAKQSRLPLMRKALDVSEPDVETDTFLRQRCGFFNDSVKLLGRVALISPRFAGFQDVNTIKHADRVLQGMSGGKLPLSETDDAIAKASKAAETHDKSHKGQYSLPTSRKG